MSDEQQLIDQFCRPKSISYIGGPLDRGHGCDTVALWPEDGKRRHFRINEDGQIEVAIYRMGVRTTDDGPELIAEYQWSCIAEITDIPGAACTYREVSE